MGAPGLGTGSVTWNPHGGVNPLLEMQVNRTAAQSLQGEQDDQEGLSKTGALAVSLCTTQTIGFVGMTWLENGKSSCKSNQSLCQQGGKGRLPDNGLELGTVR